MKNDAYLKMEIILANEFKSCTKQNFLFHIFFFHIFIWWLNLKSTNKIKKNVETLIYKWYYDIVYERKLCTKESKKSTIEVGVFVDCIHFKY